MKLQVCRNLCPQASLGWRPHAGLYPVCLLSHRKAVLVMSMISSKALCLLVLHSWPAMSTSKASKSQVRRPIT